jgi:hypothetical protein
MYLPKKRYLDNYSNTVYIMNMRNNGTNSTYASVFAAEGKAAAMIIIAAARHCAMLPT